MELRKMSDVLSVCPQISAADIPALKDAGFRTIICNRPDHEEAGQPLFSEIQAAAGSAGIEVHYLPVISGAMTHENVADFAGVMREVQGPVLAYCRSGARCANLWSLSQGS